jgi:hypothetical protein
VTRDEFPKAIRDAVAKRASFVCSNPECRALTVAPSDADASDFVYIGKVAHMSAAAPGGPRYDSSMTAQHRMDVSNALFLCSSCADLIDRNAGADFPLSRLKHWKKQHEDWVRSNLNRRVDSPLSVVGGTHEAAGVGEVTALDIQGSAIITPGTIAKATGQGSVTATRIGRRPKE